MHVHAAAQPVDLQVDLVPGGRPDPESLQVSAVHLEDPVAVADVHGASLDVEGRPLGLAAQVAPPRGQATEHPCRRPS